MIKTHTIEGQRMLARIGGLMRRVGGIVRSSHERFDGGGYPDGLVADEIPIESRIVFCCDAYNAMTTDRVYRPALSQAEALAELRANAGTQFDPVVVDALVHRVTTLRYTHAPAPPRDDAPRVSRERRWTDVPSAFRAHRRRPITAPAGRPLGLVIGPRGVASMKTAFVAIACVLTALIVSSSAQAATCAGEGTHSQRFADWGDDGDYFLAPGGDFESSSPAWTLQRGATVGDAASGTGAALSLPPGASATSPPICVAPGYTHGRMFGAATGSAARVSARS